MTVEQVIISKDLEFESQHFEIRQPIITLQWASPEGLLRQILESIRLTPGAVLSAILKNEGDYHEDF